MRLRLAILGALVATSLVAVTAATSSLATENAASTSGAQEAAAEAAAGRPNIVLVMTDDMRVDDIVFTPRVRSLIADRGLIFDNSFSPYPLCCPARASFLTGQYAHNHEVYSHLEPYGYGAFDDSRTLATSLTGAGYATGFVGKYLNGYGRDRSQVSGRPSHTYVPRGWSDWRAGIENPRRDGIHGDMYNYMDTPFNVNGRVDNRYRGDYQSDVIGDLSVDMARGFAQRDKPFFMYVNYLAPHFGGPRERDDPGLVRDARGKAREIRTPARPPWVRGMFDKVIGRAAGLPKGGGPSEANISDKPQFYKRQPEPNSAERRALRTLTRQRAESVFAMDRQIARLVAELKRSGEWDNTIFMFTSDNGYYLGEHRFRAGKIRPHEPSLRVPFVMTGPGMRSGRHISDPISTIDVSASILDLANAEPPRPLDGISRVPVMRGTDGGWRTPVVYGATNTSGAGEQARGFNDPRTSIGIRTGRYSYIRSRRGGHELYDLVADPLQNKNVFGAAAYRTDQTALDKVWLELRNCAGAECRALLPASLQTDGQQQGRITRYYWREVLKVYGFDYR